MSATAHCIRDCNHSSRRLCRTAKAEESTAEPGERPYPKAGARAEFKATIFAGTTKLFNTQIAGSRAQTNPFNTRKVQYDAKIVGYTRRNAQILT